MPGFVYYIVVAGLILVLFSLALAGGLHLVGFAVCCVGSDGWVYGWLRGFLNSIVRVMQGLL